MSMGEPARVIRSLVPVLFSHHPMCSFFSHDSYVLFGRRFCLGCSITYPLALIISLFLILTGAYHHFPEPLFHQSLMLLSSVVLGSFQLVKYKSDSENIIFKITIKVLLGVAIAGIITWVLTIPGQWYGILLLFLLGMVLLSFLGTFRLMYVNRKCAGCIYHGDWDICYGFRGVNRYHSVSDITSKAKISNLIFNKKMKRSFPVRSGPRATFDDPEPDLIDSDRWILRENLVFPWLPKTEKMVSSREQLDPRAK